MSDWYLRELRNARWDAMADEVRRPEIIAPGAFDGCDGKTVPVSVGGLGGPVVGEGVIRAAEDGAVVEMRLDYDVWGADFGQVSGGMSFAFRMPEDELDGG